MTRRPNGTWQERIKLPGMTKYKYFYGKTQKEVKQKMAAWQGEQGKKELFETVADEWNEEHSNTVAYNSHKTYQAPLGRAKEHFGDRGISDIEPEEINAYVKTEAARGYSKSTIRIELGMLGMIFDYAILKGMIKVNPCKAVKLPKGLPKEERELPTEEQMKKVKAGFCLPFGLFAGIMLYTGMRPGEILGLRWEDIDRAARTITVVRSVYFVSNNPHTKPPKTEAGKRVVPLLDALLGVLPKSGSGYIFGGDRPLQSKEFRRYWANWCKAIGLYQNGKPEIVPYQLRHAYATILYDAGIGDQDAMELMGHANIGVTRNVYTHIRQSRRDITAERLNSFIQEENKSDV